MLTVVARWRWVIGHEFYLAMMKCTQSIECHAALGKVISIAINKGIQEGLEGIEHRKVGRSLAEIGDYVDEDPTPEFRRLQPVFEQVTVPLYFERGGLRDHASISHEILLSGVLATSHAHILGRLGFMVASVLGKNGEENSSQYPYMFVK
nr:transposase (putative), gypsy type [Tanacetum cinerariifolium]